MTMIMVMMMMLVINDVVNEHLLMSNAKDSVPFFLFYLSTFCLSKRNPWAGSEAK